MLQTEKVRLSDYLDETSANLTKFTQKANAEFDQIGEEARKEIQQSGERVCLASYQNMGNPVGNFPTINNQLLFVLLLADNGEIRQPNGSV